MNPNYLWFIDVEASSTSDHSYPIEVGIAALDQATWEVVESHSWLIKPQSVWTEWSMEAQAVHGITRAELEDANPVQTVAVELSEILGNSEIYSDAVSYDGHWIALLFAEARVHLTFGIENHWAVLTSLAVTSTADNEAVRDWLDSCNSVGKKDKPHRAEADAIELATRIAAKRNELLALSA